MFVTVGFLLGILIMFIFYYSRFTRKGIVYSAGEFKRIKGVENLGAFPDGRIKANNNFLS